MSTTGFASSFSKLSRSGRLAAVKARLCEHAVELVIPHGRLRRRSTPPTRASPPVKQIAPFDRIAIDSDLSYCNAQRRPTGEGCGRRNYKPSTPPRNAGSVATANRPAPDPPQPPASSLRRFGRRLSSCRVWRQNIHHEGAHDVHNPHAGQPLMSGRRAQIIPQRPCYCARARSVSR